MSLRLADSSAFTGEFGSELEFERQVLLRRRFLWYIGAVGLINLLTIMVSVLGWVGLLSPRDIQMPLWAEVLLAATNTLTLALYAAGFAHVYSTPRPRWPVMTIAFWLIVITGGISLLTGPVVLESIRHAASVSETIETPGARRGVIQGLTVMTIFLGLWQVFAKQFFACLFLPWTPRESFRPLVPLLALNGFITLVSTAAVTGMKAAPIAWALLAIALSPLIGLPGAAVCWFRHSRLRDVLTNRILKGRYAEMRRELVDAKRIHEALFPAPITTGILRLSYIYEPMRQIGGDYLYAKRTRRVGGGEQLSLVVLDVTGHGIAAALTVNRLHGELERVYAEAPDVSPGEVLQLLNRYIHLTLATHSVYVTAFCARIDTDTDVLEYASGGHPPAYIRGVDGTVHELPSTALVLGVCADADFDPAQGERPFMPGDVLIAYTDGAIEARNAAGRPLMLRGLQSIVAGAETRARESWATRIIDAVDAYRDGPAQDDTLVIELSRSVHDVARPRVSLSRR